MRRGGDSSLSHSLYEGDTRVFQVQEFPLRGQRLINIFVKDPQLRRTWCVSIEYPSREKNHSSNDRDTYDSDVISLELETRDFPFQGDIAFSRKIISRPILFLFMLFHLSLSRS